MEGRAAQGNIPAFQRQLVNKVVTTPAFYN
jgi:hypothetical protein